MKGFTVHLLGSNRKSELITFGSTKISRNRNHVSLSFLMVCLHLRSRGRIRSGGEQILETVWRNPLVSGGNLNRSGTPIQIFYQRLVDFSARFRNPLATSADPTANPRAYKRTIMAPFVSTSIYLPRNPRTKTPTRESFP